MILYFTKKGNCPHCVAFANTAQQLQDKYGNDFIELDCNDPSIKAFAKAFGVTMVPTIAYIDGIFLEDISTKEMTDIESVISQSWNALFNGV